MSSDSSPLPLPPPRPYIALTVGMVAGGSALLMLGVAPLLASSGVARGMMVGGGALVCGVAAAWGTRRVQRRLHAEALELHERLNAQQTRVDETSAQLQRANERVAVLEQKAELLRDLESRLLSQQSTFVRGRMTAGLAHGFNNMLGGIMGYASAVEEVPDLSVTELRHYLSQISSSSQRATLLCHQLLVASSRQSSADDVVHLVRFRQEVLPLLEACIGSGVTLKVEVEHGLPSARADIAGLQMTLANLAFNALESFTGRTGEINLAVSKTSLGVAESRSPFGASPDGGEYLRFTLTDDGSGMDESVRARALEPFFTTKENHLGLGLTAVDRWVRSRQGALVVRPGREKGTVVELYLPAVLSVFGATDSRPAVAGLSETVSTAKSNGLEEPGVNKIRRVLVVDDDPTLREFSTMLMEHAGLTVFVADGGREALKLHETKGPFDLALVDYQMPGLDGVETIAAMRASGATTRFVLMSGSLPKEIPDLEQAGELLDFLPKPFTPSMMRELLLKVFGEMSGRR
ncbi:response regulator [Synoicihabitans lomoniglobus]|uniref:histidine kinase n=1 Tax=Synoicihabitans lomoniglobus TaxID=2909285 RepID=A0AAE9ZUX3_9BACT|nr:response regulator [Opitutaceae bacterium LMO-M01]WED64557.1 response regulator [Opitutaceae bacterium LMO-M01]